MSDPSMDELFALANIARGLSNGSTNIPTLATLAQNTSKESLFMKLPIEVRYMIYDQLHGGRSISILSPSRDGAIGKV